MPQNPSKKHSNKDEKCGILKNMSLAFLIQAFQVTSAILLIIAVLLQHGEANVGSAFGGGDVSETGNTKRRGSEKILFIITFIIAILFMSSVVLPLIIT